MDTEEEDLINLNSDIIKRREPDAVTWINNYKFATANEGDYEDAMGDEGGSRGFTIFDLKGQEVYESAESFEHLLVAAGHYNEGRSENKGVEPEAVEYGEFRGNKMLFVGSERSNAVGVYEVSNPYEPKLLQVMPTGMGPEGLKAIPKRGLFIVSTESEVAGDGIPTMINIYGYRSNRDRAPYPMVVSGNDVNGLPIPWVALSGLAADPYQPRKLYAVSDSFLAEGFIYTIDASARPAVIVDRVQVDSDALTASPDLEGISVGLDGTFWLASEGNASRPNAIIHTDAAGSVLAEITLPSELEDNKRNNGFEGIAVTGQPGKEVVYVAIQRAWPDTGDIDEVNTKIGRYDTVTGQWTFVLYPLQPEGNGGWIGLSDLTELPDGSFAVIERDKGWGESTGPVAELKAVFTVDLAKADFRPYKEGGELATLDKSLLIDALPALQRRSIWTAEKLEGFAVDSTGRTFFVTDNDGVDDAPGETLFFSLGNIRRYK